jgi:hypothetical protein
MNAVLFLVAMAGLSAPGLGQTAVAPEVRMHTRTSFDLVVHAPYAEAAPLFGPEGERAWAGKHWDPQFVFPQPARDEEGAVFTVRHGPFNAVWVNTLFDVKGQHFQYVYFLADVMVTTIDVRFMPQDAKTTQVNVAYTRTALTAEGDEHVAVMSDGDRKAGAEWQAAIDEYLAAHKDGQKH